MFMAPWCGHCRKAKPQFISAYEKRNSLVPFILVDCTVNHKVCDGNHITGYPTFKFFTKSYF